MLGEDDAHSLVGLATPSTYRGCREIAYATLLDLHVAAREASVLAANDATNSGGGGSGNSAAAAKKREDVRGGAAMTEAQKETVRCALLRGLSDPDDDGEFIRCDFGKFMSVRTMLMMLTMVEVMKMLVTLMKMTWVSMLMTLRRGLQDPDDEGGFVRCALAWTLMLMMIVLTVVNVVATVMVDEENDDDDDDHDDFEVVGDFDYVDDVDDVDVGTGNIDDDGDEDDVPDINVD